MLNADADFIKWNRPTHQNTNGQPKLAVKRPENYGGNYGFWASQLILFQMVTLFLIRAGFYVSFSQLGR